jgi:hypothetical protein
MNTKSYINYFSEIAFLSDEEQLEVLEKARYCAFTDLQLNGKDAGYFIMSIALGCVVPIASFVLFGFSIILNALATGIGVVITLLVYKKLYATILQKGLSKVLMENVT